MVADFNVGRLHEVVEPATLEADAFSQTDISAEFSSFLLFFGVSKLLICKYICLNVRVAGGNTGRW